MPVSVLCTKCRERPVERQNPPERIRLIIPCSECVKRFGRKIGD